MGFDPGNFRERDGSERHWGLKSGGRIVLWNTDESQRLLDLDTVEARKALDLLELLVGLAEGAEKT